MLGSYLDQLLSFWSTAFVLTGLARLAFRKFIKAGSKRFWDGFRTISLDFRRDVRGPVSCRSLLWHHKKHPSFLNVEVCPATPMFGEAKSWRVTLSSPTNECHQAVERFLEAFTLRTSPFSRTPPAPPWPHKGYARRRLRQSKPLASEWDNKQKTSNRI